MEMYHEGRVPLRTLRANIDYGFAENNGVWQTRSEVLDLPERREAGGKRKRSRLRPCPHSEENFMPLMPARVKYRKMHRGSRAGLATRGHTVAFGECGLQAMERCWLDTKQIEAARVAVTRFMKRRGKVWIRIFPHKSFTKKPLETRWARAKARWNRGWRSSALPTCCSKWTA